MEGTISSQAISGYHVDGHPICSLVQCGPVTLRAFWGASITSIACSQAVIAVERGQCLFMRSCIDDLSPLCISAEYLSLHINRPQRSLDTRIDLRRDLLLHWIHRCNLTLIMFSSALTICPTRWFPITEATGVLQLSINVIRSKGFFVFLKGVQWNKDS